MLDTLWIAGSIFLPNTSSWNGYMSSVNYTATISCTKIEPLPFVNLDPSNLHSIYTALTFAAETSERYGKCCIVTFDQPLFLKAVDIVEGSNSTQILGKVIVRLGGFHMLMSFMGSIGHLMSGSGIEDLWQTVYAKNTIPHLISGHAYSRSLRAHFLTQEALSHIIFKHILFQDIETLEKLYLNPDVENIEGQEILKKLVEEFDAKLSSFAQLSRTATLWANYWKYVQIIKWFIRAERSGLWLLHIEAVKLMIPIFFSTGHNNYGKSSLLYLQQMEKLKNINPVEYSKFTDEGLFTIRRKKKHWTGTWSDMVIEQNLMRAIKTTGGLTHGRGVKDSTLARWVASMSVCTAVSRAIDDFVGIEAVVTDQHVELKSSRKDRDNKDFNKMIDWLNEHDPSKCTEFLSISTRILAQPEVNCDKADEKGKEIMNDAVGKQFTEIQCKKSKVVKSLASSNRIKIGTRDVVVNPLQLFSRIVCSNKSPQEIKLCFQYELAPYPLSLFKDGLLRKGVKSQLYKEFDSLVTPSPNPINETVFVIDGGLFLHKVVWQKPATYHEICLQYVNFALHSYTQKTFIVFDGYDTDITSTKDAIQRFRSQGSVEVSVTPDSIAAVSQADFLKSNKNKQSFINILKGYLLKAGFVVQQAQRDADVDIVLTAVNQSEFYDTVTVLSEDTDVAVLLLHHTKTSNIFLMRPGKGAKADKVTQISTLQQQLGHNIKSSILFLHAMSGCDTTSFLFKKSKKQLLSALKKDGFLCHRASLFLKQDAPKEELFDIGFKCILKWYGANKVQKLNDFRFILYNKIISRQKLAANFNLAVLPPTEEAAKEHILRVYFQVKKLV